MNVRANAAALASTGGSIFGMLLFVLTVFGMAFAAFGWFAAYSSEEPKLWLQLWWAVLFGVPLLIGIYNLFVTVRIINMPNWPDFVRYAAASLLAFAPLPMVWLFR